MEALFERGDFHNNIANEINENIRYFSLKSYKTSTKPYNSLMENKEISIERKKSQLLKSLHKLMAKTFAIDFSKIKGMHLLAQIKNNIKILRALALKLRNINYHLETTFLDDIGIKHFFPGTKKMDQLVRDDQKAVSKRDINKLEDTSIRLIERIINLDKRALKGYRRKEKRIVTKERLGVKDLNRILVKQSELLCHLEAKLPPPNKMQLNLLSKKNFTKWASRVLALLCMLEEEYGKESMIFKKLKNAKRIEKKINEYINHISKEKWEMLQLKQKKIMFWDKAEEIDREWKRLSHHWLTTMNL